MCPFCIISGLDHLEGQLFQALELGNFRFEFGYSSRRGCIVDQAFLGLFHFILSVLFVKVIEIIDFFQIFKQILFPNFSCLKGDLFFTKS